MPLTGVLLLLAVGAVVAAPLGVIYILAIRYIPFIYLNLLAIAAYGIGFAFVVAKLVELGRLRSPAAAGLLGCIAGLAATWLQWVFFAAFIVHDETISLVAACSHFLTHPAALGGFIQYVAGHGTWSFKDGDPVTGVFLILIWIAETLTIVVPAALFAYGQAGKPFSELLQRWAVPVRLPGRLPFFASPAEVRARLESGDLMPLVTNEPPAGHQYARLELYSAEGDPSCFYLSVENVSESLDKKGRKQTATAAIATHLHLPAELAKQLQELHSTAPAA